MRLFFACALVLCSSLPALGGTPDLSRLSRCILTTRAGWSFTTGSDGKVAEALVDFHQGDTVHAYTVVNEEGFFRLPMEFAEATRPVRLQVRVGTQTKDWTLFRIGKNPNHLSNQLSREVAQHEPVRVVAEAYVPNEADVNVFAAAVEARIGTRVKRLQREADQTLRLRRPGVIEAIAKYEGMVKRAGQDSVEAITMHWKIDELLENELSSDEIAQLLGLMHANPLREAILEEVKLCEPFLSPPLKTKALSL